jgi:hypothetical protein
MSSFSAIIPLKLGHARVMDNQARPLTVYCVLARIHVSPLPAGCCRSAAEFRELHGEIDAFAVVAGAIGIGLQLRSMLSC